MSKIKRNTVTNLKALSNFTADFNGCSAIITGKNNGGKSSFLKSLPERLKGIKPSIILKTGESEGMQEIELTTGERLLWSFDNKTKAGERLIYITKDENGKEIRSSLTEVIMKRFFPGSFDIDVFLNSSPAKQRKMLQDIVGLDFTSIDDRYKVAYEERTFANKKLSDAKANLKPIDESLPADQIDTVEIQKSIWAIDKHNADYDKANSAIHDPKHGLIKQKSDNDAMIKDFEAKIRKLQAENKTLDTRISDGQQWLASPDNQKKDDQYHFQLNKQLQDAIDKNKLIEKNKEALKMRNDFSQLDIQAKAKDKAVKDIEAEKTKMIKGAKMPDGFGFTDTGITYNGLPVEREQLSSSAIYIAALKLALMTIGEVRTLHFDASFLDINSLKEVEKWAVDNDLQLLIEMVDREAGEIRYELIEEIK